MKYAIEVGSGAMIHITNFVKTGLGIQNLLGGYTYRQKQQGDLKSLF
jgi:hypothetical protein